MTDNSKRLSKIRPVLRRRTCGGWIAISPASAGLSLGVTAPTEKEAVERFGFEFSRWLEILDSKILDVPNADC